LNFLNRQVVVLLVPSVLFGIVSLLIAALSLVATWALVVAALACPDYFALRDSQRHHHRSHNSGLHSNAWLISVPFF
jgi:hypothetical protein